MNILYKIFNIMCFCLTASSVLSQDSTSTRFPFYVEIESEFTKAGFVKHLNFTNNLNRDINLTYEGHQEITFAGMGLPVPYGTAVILPASGNLPLRLMLGKVPLSENILCPLFRTDTKVNGKDTISICVKQFEVASHQFRKHDTLTIELSKTKFDSIAVYFPPGGTTTTISVYKNRKEKKPIRAINYEYGSNEKNDIVFKKWEKGKYFITLVSCHWSGHIWLNIK